LDIASVATGAMSFGSLLDKPYMKFGTDIYKSVIKIVNDEMDLQGKPHFRLAKPKAKSTSKLPTGVMICRTLKASPNHPSNE
jgi:hypothetical protein